MKNHVIENVSRETFEEVDYYFDRYNIQMVNYAEQIQWWNHKLNLMSRSVSLNVIMEHLRHSLSPIILEELWTKKHIVDGGTGGGLPGVPLGIVLETPKLHLVDINQKKITALKQMVDKVSAKDFDIRCDDIYSYQPESGSVFVSKHAFKFSEFFKEIDQSSYEEFIFLKGDDYELELKYVPEEYSVTAYKLETGTTRPFFKKKYVIRIHKS